MGGLTTVDFLETMVPLLMTVVSRVEEGDLNDTNFVVRFLRSPFSLLTIIAG